jgi:hypothetical protein
MMDGLAFLPVPDLTIGIHLLRTLCPDDPPEAAELLYYFAPLDDTPYRRMGMSYKVEELVVPALHMLLVLASPLTVASCTFQMAGGDLTIGQKTIAEFLCGVGWNIRLNHQH